MILELCVKFFVKLHGNLSEMHFGVNDDAILKANCKSYKIFIFLHQFFFAFPQCNNNNIAKSENFFMEIQKKHIHLFLFQIWIDVFLNSI